MNLKYRVTLAISFILIGCGSKGESEPIPNPDRERSFVGTLTLNERVSDSMSAPLLTPGSLLLSGDRIFVSDFGDHRVKVFDLEGRFRRAIGKGQGQGPGELIQIGGHEVWRDTLYVVDMMGRKVVKYTMDGDVAGQFTVNHPINRIAVRNDTALVIGLGGDLFHAYDLAGRPQGTFSQFTDDAVRPPLSIGGNLHASPGHDRFVFVPSYASYVYHLTSQGVDRSVRGVDGVGYPDGGSGTSSASSRRFGRPNVQIHQSDAGVVEGTIQALVNLPEGTYGDPPGTRYLDVYNYETGAYRHTIRIPAPVRYARRYRDRVYAILPDSASARVYDLAETP